MNLHASSLSISLTEGSQHYGRAAENLTGSCHTDDRSQPEGNAHVKGSLSEPEMNEAGSAQSSRQPTLQPMSPTLLLQHDIAAAQHRHQS